MINVFEDLKKGKYCHIVPKSVEDEDIKSDRDKQDEASDDVCVNGEVVDVSNLPGGDVYDSEDHISLHDVPVITPCGDVVVSRLSFEVLY